MDAWQTQNQGTLSRFSATIQKAGEEFSASWQGLTGSVNLHISRLVKDWQSSLDQAVDEMKTSLRAVQSQLKQTEALSEALSRSAHALARAAEAMPKGSGAGQRIAPVPVERKTDASWRPAASSTQSPSPTHSDQSRRQPQARPSGTKPQPSQASSDFNAPPDAQDKRPWYRRWRRS